MIEIKKAKQELIKHVKEQKIENEKVDKKLEHILRVAEISKKIATELNLETEQIKLAELIGLLHDIGRFEQIKQLKEYNENKLDHAEFGVKVLFENNIIRKFIEDNKYDEIIKKAIYNHNKYQIQEDVNEKELLHCKIIRDSDKLDNFRVKEKEKLENMFPKIYNEETINYEKISPKVYEDFMKNKCIELNDRKTMIDYWVCVIAFIFDLNFDISLKYIRDNNYIDILVNRIEYKNQDTKEKMEEIRKCANKYIENISK